MTISNKYKSFLKYATIPALLLSFSVVFIFSEFSSNESLEIMFICCSLLVYFLPQAVAAWLCIYAAERENSLQYLHWGWWWFILQTPLTIICVEWHQYASVCVWILFTLSFIVCSIILWRKNFRKSSIALGILSMIAFIQQFFFVISAGIGNID